MLLVGNSYSKDIYNVLANSYEADNNFQIARYGVQIRNISNYTHSFYQSKNYTNSDTVIIASSYSKDDMDALVNIVAKMISDGKKVAIVRQIFIFKYENDKTIADIYLQDAIRKNVKIDNHFIKKAVREIDSAYYQQYISYDGPRYKLPNLRVDEIIKHHEGVVALDRMDYACDHVLERCFAINDKLEKFYYDSMHHSLEGAEFYGDRIDKIGWLNPLIDGPNN